MLYFSKFRIVSIYIFILFISFFTLLNFFDIKSDFFDKKINLGLDLQGGSYLLLEIDNRPIIEQKLQNKLTSLKKYFLENKINFKNLRKESDKIIFETDNLSKDKFINEFNNKKNSEINNFYNQYKSFEYDLIINDNIIEIFYTKYGLIELKNASIDQSLEIVRRRVDEVGTNEPNILKRGNERILVELPGLDDPSRIKKLLGKTANLTFRFISQENVESFGSETLKFEDNVDEAYVSKRIVLSGDNLVDAQPKMDTQNNMTVVTFSLDRAGAKRFAKATTEGINRRLAIVLDNKIISAPVIREPIISGSGQISGNFTFQSATDLALLLRSGSLPAPINIIEERTVGPDLGKDSIRSGIISLIIGFSLVIIFMFIKYKIFGLIANFSLIVNLFLLIGFLTIFEATLTLPGIAGIILTVGMAVDANVLIFERIKEEIKLEENKLAAFDDGYKKSRTAILDANITTLISAIILFFLGSGPIKGFSITLGVGILTTLFTVYFFARQLTSFYIYKNKNTDIKL